MINLLKKESPKLFCKSCFKDIKQNSFKNMFNNTSCLCNKCYEEMDAVWKRKRIDGCMGFIIYKYNNFFKEKLYALKGCYDIEMAPIFLDKFKGLLKIWFKNFVIVPAPSSKESDEERGFIHLNEIFKILNLPIENCLYKKVAMKQSDLNYEERKNIINIIDIKEGTNLSGKNVLFVDDVYTSGTTAKVCVSLIKKQHPKKLRFLILSSKFSGEKV